MLSWRDVMDQEVRRADSERRARQWRLAQAEQAGLPTRGARLAALMIRLGAWMERTGCRLQTRFAQIDPSPMLSPASAETQMNGCS
jgi:hypothetical protein